MAVLIHRRRETILIHHAHEPVPARVTRSGPGTVVFTQGAWQRWLVRSADESRELLRRLRISQDELAGLRSLLRNDILDSRRLSPDAVITLIAARVAQGRLVVRISTETWRTHSATAPLRKPSEAPPPRTQTRAASAPPPPANWAAYAAHAADSKPKAESTFSASADVAAQVATLVAAAEQGVPFCEECEKARKAREAEAAEATA